MATERDPLPDVNGWEALHLQMIAFPLEGQALVAAPPARWHEVTGEEPSQTKKQPFSREESGSYQKGVLTVLSDPVKIAWIATPRPVVADAAATDAASRPLTLKRFPEKRDWFVNVMSQWLPKCPRLYRLAFVAKLIRTAEGGPAGVSKLLNSYLHPKVQVDSDPSDFIYRINRKCTSKTLGLEDWQINRLATWSALMFTLQFQAMGLEAGTGAIVLNTPAKPTEYAACSLDLDISTVPGEKKELPHERLPQLFQELATLGTAIAERGESNG